MKFRWLLFFLASMMSQCASSQPIVESGAYNLMLHTLLSREVKEIGVTQAYQQKDSILFLDSRSREEFEVSHLKEAIWIGYEAFDSLKVAGIAQDKKIVVYCSVGARSEKITEKLYDLGFTDVANLYGGIFEWVNAGYPVYKGTTPTDDVHAYNKIWGVWLKKGNKVYN